MIPQKSTNRQQKVWNTLYRLTQFMKESGHYQNLPAMGAAIVYKGDIVGLGYNNLKSHPFALKFSKHPEAIFLHAEIAAIHNAMKILTNEELSKCDLYILRYKSNRTLGLAKPCEGCMKAIVQFGIKKVFYTVDANDMTEEFFSKL